MRLIRAVQLSALICATTVAVCGTVASADGGGDSDADASVDGSTLQVSAEIASDVAYTGGGDGSAGGTSGGGESAGGRDFGESAGGGGGGGGSAWTWSPADLGGGTIYEDGGYGEYSLVFGDQRVNSDGTVERLYLGDSRLLPGSLNDTAWVGPSQPQAAVPAAAAAPLPRPPTVAEILPGLRQRMEAVLEAPAVEFVGLDPEFGWAYVVVPVGFRVTNTAPIAVTASVSAGPFTAWATITATPTEIRFDPGEPGGRVVVCPPAAAASAAFDSARPDACSYRYDNSSAVAGNGRTFETTTSMVYAITYQSSEGPGSFPAVTMSSTAELAVAEIQALVTCTGPRPEQGGC